jgi:glycosyltransferase involved in cell wall biosynthesis
VEGGGIVTTRPRTVVCVTQAPFIGGAEQALLRLATGLDPSRYRTVVVAGHDGPFAAALRASSVAHHCIVLPAADRARPLRFARCVARLTAMLWRERAVLLYVNDAPAHTAAAVAARLLRLPRLLHLRFQYPAAGLRWFLRGGFEHAVFASRSLHDWARAQCPDLFPLEQCTVVANGFDPPAPPPPDRLAAVARAAGLSAGDQVVGFVGRVVDTKGVEDYLHMAAALAARFPSCRFLIVGDDHGPPPTYRARMEELARQLAIADRCRFVGFRDDVWTMLHLCDVVVIPSRVEPFGNVAIEAGAAARPVVATRVGGLPEIVRDGETGLLVPPGEPQAVAEGVARLLVDGTLRRSLGERARERVSACFSLSAHARRMADLFDEVCAAGVKREA